MENEKAMLNPDIRKLKVGVRELREITIYPLAAADQFKLSDAITEVVQQFLMQPDQSDMAFVMVIIEIVKQNIGKLLELTVDKSERGRNILSEITNNQLAELADIIYTVNFQNLQKKVTSLLQGMGVVQNLESPGRRSSQPSLDDTLPTDSKTSTESPGEKEA
jgi:hypothetical protein